MTHASSVFVTDLDLLTPK